MGHTHNHMIFTLVFLALLTLTLGLCALLINVHRAPEGFEDVTGFHACAPTSVKQPYYDAFASQHSEMSPATSSLGHAHIAA